jgi:3'-phosphoadenosine 5'-phosphosulfate (PAPS) 3'-phosphatase
MSFFVRGFAFAVTLSIVTMGVVVEPVIASPDFERAYISSPNGSHLGYTVWQGNQQIAFAQNGTRLGYYDRATDTTRAPSGQIVARGNAVAAFIITLR